MASKSKSKMKRKQANRPVKDQSSRSSSACSSGCSSSCSTNNQMNEKLNSFKSTSQSNLSDISSGFSSASTENSFNKSDKSRSCSPSSTISSFSLFLSTRNVRKNGRENKCVMNARTVLGEIDLNRSDLRADKNDLITDIKCANKVSEKSVKSDLINRIKLRKSVISQRSVVNCSLKLCVYILQWLYKHSDYITILTVTILCNLNTLDAGFVYDDNRAIKTNRDVEWSTPMFDLFKNDFWGTPIHQNSSHKSYRPLCVLTFKLNHYFHQYDARGYHLVNLIFHCLVCLIYTSLVKRWTYRNVVSKSNNELSFDFLSFKQLIETVKLNWINQLPPLYLVASLLFCLHPIHVEAVAGLVGRADIGCALFFLLSLHFYDNYLERSCVSDLDEQISLNDPNQRGRKKYKERRLMQRIFKENGNNATSNWSTCYSFIQLYLAIICGAISMLFKEYGLTVFAVLAFYHLITHCGHLANQSRLDRCSSGRWRAYQLATSNRSDKSCTTPQSNGQFLAFFRTLHAILSHTTFSRVRRAWLHLLLTSITILSLRIWIMGEIKSPKFSLADNPTATHKCALTRTLTFLYLITFNFWLLICPITLSFDWSMESIPLVQLNDLRNFSTLVLFACLIYFVGKLISHYTQIIEMSTFEVQDALDDQSSSGSESGYSNEFYKLHSSESSSCESSGSYTFKPYNLRRNYESSFERLSTHFRDTTGRRTFTSLDICSISIILLVLPFLPASNLLWYVGFVVAERCLYIPSMGFCLLISVALVRSRQQLVASISSLISLCETSLGLTHHKKANHVDKSTDYEFKSKQTNRLLTKHLQLVKLFDTWPNKSLDLHQFAKLLFNFFLYALFVCYAYRTYVRNFDWATEETLYRSAINVNPPKALGNLASILSTNGLVQEAEATYREALKHRYNMGDVHYNLGILLQEQKRYEEALISYRNAIKYRPRLAAAYLNMGFIYNLIQQREKAIEIYKHCASINGDGLKDPRTHEQSKISALFNLGKLYADQGDYKQALQTYEQAIENEAIQAYYQIHSLYNSIGEAYLHLGEFEQAERSFLKAFKFKQDHLPLYLNYAKFLQKVNRLQDAEQWYLNARLLAPNDTSVILHFGQFLCDRKKYEQAADIYTDAIENGLSYSFELLFNFANVLRLARRTDEAEHYYKLAVDLNPSDTSGHLNLGAMLHLNGKLIEAEEHYLLALKLRPNDSIAISNLEKLHNLMNRKK